VACNARFLNRRVKELPSIGAVKIWHSGWFDVSAQHQPEKDGKDHRYFSIVENQRVSGSKTVQRTVLYLGEINRPTASIVGAGR